MKAIILAAGRGTRLRPITDITPKPLIPIQGRPILEHLLEKIVHYIDEITLVVNYKQEMFSDYFGEAFCGIPIKYHIQGDKKGTGAAIEDISYSDDLLLLYADTIFSKRDIEELICSSHYGCLVKEVENPEKYGIFSQDAQGFATAIIEKPENYVGNLANLGVYKLPFEILNICKKLQPSKRGEYEITDGLDDIFEKHKFQLIPIKEDFLDISFPEDIQRVENILKESTLKVLEQKTALGISKYITTIKNFEVHYGIDISLISSLIEYSQDERDIAMIENTGDKKRFSSYEKIEQWYQDSGRIFFSLVSHDKKLAGIWWGRPCKIPYLEEVQNLSLYDFIKLNSGNLHTNAVRIYPQFRGQKIASPWVNICTLLYSYIHPTPIMTADVKEDNTAMLKGFSKLGYKEIGIGESQKSVSSKEQKRIVLIQENN